MTAMDNIPSGVEFTEPTPIIEDMRSNGRNVAFSNVVGYRPGSLTLPDHPAKTGKLWYYAIGSCSTAGAGPYSHTILEADTPPFLGFPCELEHATTANNYQVDLLGVVCETITLTFGQDDPTSISAGYKVSYAMTGNNLARDTSLDFLGNYLPGQFNATLQYNSTTTNATILSGTVTVKNKIEFTKSNSLYPTEAIFLARDYEISLNARLTNRTLLDIPDDPEDYSSKKITLNLKVYKGASSATDYQQFSFTSLRMDKLMASKIDEEMYVWEAGITLHNAGARNATTSAGKLNMKIVDDLSGGHYED
jgi:hypothetical protein